MKRRIVWSMVAIVAVIVLGAIAFLNVFEQVPTTRHEPAKMEAWLNPFLALERTVTRLGRPVIHLQRSLAAKDLPERSTLILDRNHQHQIASAQTMDSWRAMFPATTAFTPRKNSETTAAETSGSGRDFTSASMPA